MTATDLDTSTSKARTDRAVRGLGKAGDSDLTQRFCEAFHKGCNLGQVISAIDNFVAVMEDQRRRGRHGMAHSDRQDWWAQ